MIFGRDGESVMGKNMCSSYTTLPERRMSTQSLICEAASLYPSVHRQRQGSLCHLDKIAYDSCIAQLNELRDARLPPPMTNSQSRRRRLSVASSQAALAGSGLAYMGSNGSRCHSSLGNYGLEPELWLARRMSMTQSELMNEINFSPCSTTKRWSEAGRSCGETTIQASLRQFRTQSDLIVPASRQPSSRRMASEEHSMSEDLMDMSFSDSLMEPNMGTYEKIPRKDRKRRSNKNYQYYDDPSSLKQHKGT